MNWAEELREKYPSALSWPELVERSQSYLLGRGFTPENTLFANALCRDEVNQRSVSEFVKFWGENFDLAGLGGYPSAGITGFSACHHHVPEDDGRLFILFGPHVGLGRDGTWGQVEREGQQDESPDCGELMGYLGKIQQDAGYEPRFEPLDAEQYLLESALTYSKEAILGHEDPVLAATERLFEVIDGVLGDIIRRMAPSEPTVLLGGLLINTPLGEDDAFVPRLAVVLNADGQPGRIEDWIEKL
ncbi:MAG: hypothetical protein V2A76_07385 [Planctomycetota bacterium]